MKMYNIELIYRRRKSETQSTFEPYITRTNHYNRGQMTGIKKDEHQRYLVLIESFSSADNRQTFEERVKRCKRPELKTSLFCFMPPDSVEVILSHDCGLDVSRIDVEELKKELRISPHINVELLALEEESSFHQTAFVTVSPGDEISGEHDHISSSVTMFGTDPVTGERFVVLAGHKRTVGDQLTFGQLRHFATVNLVKLVLDGKRSSIDVALAKLDDTDIVVNNEVTIDGRLTMLSQQVESSVDSVNKLVQKFHSSSGDKKGIIRSIFSDGKSFRECFEILCVDDGRPIHGDGESGILVFKVAAEADQTASGIRQEVRGIGILVGLYSMKFANGKVRNSSVAIPLDRTMNYLKSEFPRLQILRTDVLAENIAVSTWHGDGESLSLPIDGHCLEMRLQQGSDAGFVMCVQEQSVNDDAKPTEEVTGRQADRPETIVTVVRVVETEREPSYAIPLSPSLLTQVELNTHQTAIQTTESPQEMGVERRRPRHTLTPSTRKTLKTLAYDRHIADDGPSRNVTEVHSCSASASRNASAASKQQLKQHIYGRTNEADNNDEAKLLTATQMYHEELFHGQHVKTMHSLPYELHEMLLKRSSCLLAKTLLKTDTRPSIQLFNILSSVCRYFHFILTVRRRSSVRTFIKQQLTVACRPYRLHPLRLTLIGGHRQPMLGMCILNEQLFVLRTQLTTIDVYTPHQQSYSQLRSIQTRFGYIAAIASCSINMCVYVAGIDTERRGSVDRVTAGYKVVQWLQNVGSVGKLSVTSDGRVVLLIATDVQGRGESITYRGRVEVYNSVGVKLTLLKLPHDIVNPWHVVQTANRSFIVCHGDHNTELQRICEVNNTGVIATSFGGKPGSGLGQLNGPFHFALDCEERVLVLDSINQRILLLDRQLTIRRVLLTWSGAANCPGRLLYDRKEKRLFVAFFNGCLEIYSL